MGYDVQVVETVDAALPRLTQQPVFSTVLIVACLPSERMREAYEDLIEGLRAIRRASSHSQIVLTVDSSVSIELCCQAINSGVAAFLEVDDSGFDAEALKRRLDQARVRYELSVTDAAKLHSGQIFDSTGIVGCSRAMALLLSQAARAADVSDAPVLIYGESGTGKQLLAEMIHRLDPKRSAKSFLSVNCAAIAGSLADSALFGHVRGAYTGATEARAGYFRAAHGGTVFLDEISELSPALQPKLLRFLQEGLVMPVGSDTEYPADVRIIAAANRRIPALIEDGKFRLDLYQRLNVITLDIPPLRERSEDIPLLIDFFVKKYASYYGRPISRVDKRVYELLTRCTLNGNVRELENTIRRALAIKVSGDELVLGDLPNALIEQHTKPARVTGPLLSMEAVETACNMIASGAMTLPDFIDECEKLVLAHAIVESADSHADLSKRLGLSTRTLYNKRKRYRI